MRCHICGKQTIETVDCILVYDQTGNLISRDTLNSIGEENTEDVRGDVCLECISKKSVYNSMYCVQCGGDCGCVDVYTKNGEYFSMCESCAKGTSYKKVSFEQINTKGQKTVGKLKTIGMNNKEHAVHAAKIGVGKVLLSRAKKLIKPKLPIFLRGYVEKDEPISDIVIAVIVDAAIVSVAQNNKKAQLASDCLMSAAYASGAGACAEILDGLLDGIDLSSVEETE